MRFADCQGLAGAWSLGTVQAGFELAHRVSLPGGFGDYVMDANRRLVGDRWEQETGPPHEAWTPQEVDLVIGTPPCSGFSLLNISKGPNARGASSSINSCMRELVEYGAACTGTDGKQGAQVVAFESVQGAYTEGRGLMITLRDLLTERTRSRYELTHVLLAGAAVGAAQFRHRYYPVFHRVPFGVETPRVEDLPDGRLVTYLDSIGDLAGAPLKWEAQPYPRGATSSFSAARRNPSGTFEDHVPIDFKGKAGAVRQAYEAGWPRGMGLNTACEVLRLRPASMEKAWMEHEGKYRGWGWPRRVRSDRCGYVLTGSAGAFIHWDECRSFTVREISRLMGYPDCWIWPDFGNHKRSAALLGKCCPVDSGRWISSWIKRSLEGSPGSDQVRVEPGENYHNSTNVYKDWPGADVPPKEDLAVGEVL